MAKQTINIGTVANDGTGDALRDAFDKTNDNFTELYDRQRFGVYNYDNNLGTQALTASTWTHALNDGLGANTILGGALSGVDIYDTTTNNFDFADMSLYDTIDYRFDANITTTSVNQEVRVRLLLSVGTLNIPLTFVSNIFKTAGTYPLFGFIQSHIFTELVRTTPARFEVWTDASATLDVNGWAVKAIKRQG